MAPRFGPAYNKDPQQNTTPAATPAPGAGGFTFQPAAAQPTQRFGQQAQNQPQFVVPAVQNPNLLNDDEYKVHARAYRNSYDSMQSKIASGELSLEDARRQSRQAADLALFQWHSAKLWTNQQALSRITDERAPASEWSWGTQTANDVKGALNSLLGWISPGDSNPFAADTKNPLLSQQALTEEQQAILQGGYQESQLSGPAFVETMEESEKPIYSIAYTANINTTGDMHAAQGAGQRAVEQARQDRYTNIAELNALNEERAGMQDLVSDWGEKMGTYRGYGSDIDIVDTMYRQRTALLEDEGVGLGTEEYDQLKKDAETVQIYYSGKDRSPQAQRKALAVIRKWMEEDIQDLPEWTQEEALTGDLYGQAMPLIEHVIGADGWTRLSKPEQDAVMQATQLLKNPDQEEGQAAFLQRVADIAEQYNAANPWGFGGIEINRSAYQTEPDEQAWPESVPLTQEQRNARMLADQERIEREERDAGDRVAGALNEQDLAWKKLQELSSSGALDKIENKTLRENAYNAMYTLEMETKAGRVVDPAIMAVIQEAIDATQDPEKAETYGQREGVFAHAEENAPWIAQLKGLPGMAMDEMTKYVMTEAQLIPQQMLLEQKNREYYDLNSQLLSLEKGTQEYEETAQKRAELKSEIDELKAHISAIRGNSELQQMAADLGNYLNLGANPDYNGPTLTQDVNMAMTTADAPTDAFLGGLLDRAINGNLTITRGLMDIVKELVAEPLAGLVSPQFRRNIDVSSTSWVTDNPITQIADLIIGGHADDPDWRPAPWLENLLTQVYPDYKPGETTWTGLMDEAKQRADETAEYWAQRGKDLGIPLDQDVMQGAIGTFLNKSLISGAENLGRMSYSMLSSHSNNIQHPKWTETAGGFGTIVNKTIDVMNTFGFNRMYGDLLAEEFNNIYATYGEDANIWHFLMALPTAGGSSIVEYYETRLGNGVQGFLTRGARMGWIKNTAATMLQESYEENMQTFLHRAGTDLANWFSGEDLQYDISWDMLNARDTLFSLADSWDITVDTMWSTFGMELSMLPGSGSVRGHHVYREALEAYENGNASSQQEELAKKLIDAGAAVIVNDQMQLEEAENNSHDTFDQALTDPNAGMTPTTYQVYGQTYAQAMPRANLTDVQVRAAEQLRERGVPEEMIQRAVNGQLQPTEWAALRMLGVEQEQIDHANTAESVPGLDSQNDLFWGEVNNQASVQETAQETDEQPAPAAQQETEEAEQEKKPVPPGPAAQPVPVAPVQMTPEQAQTANTMRMMGVDEELIGRAVRGQIEPSERAALEMLGVAPEELTPRQAPQLPEPGTQEETRAEETAETAEPAAQEETQEQAEPERNQPRESPKNRGEEFGPRAEEETEYTEGQGEENLRRAAEEAAEEQEDEESVPRDLVIPPYWVEPPQWAQNNQEDWTDENGVKRTYYGATISWRDGNGVLRDSHGKPYKEIVYPGPLPVEEFAPRAEEEAWNGQESSPTGEEESMPQGLTAAQQRAWRREQRRKQRREAQRRRWGRQDEQAESEQNTQPRESPKNRGVEFGPQDEAVRQMGPEPAPEASFEEWFRADNIIQGEPVSRTDHEEAVLNDNPNQLANNESQSGEARDATRQARALKGARDQAEAEAEEENSARQEARAATRQARALEGAQAQAEAEAAEENSARQDERNATRQAKALEGAQAQAEAEAAEENSARQEARDATRQARALEGAQAQAEAEAAEENSARQDEQDALRQAAEKLQQRQEAERARHQRATEGQAAAETDAQRVTLNEEDDTPNTNQPIAGDDGARPEDTGTADQQTAGRRPLAPDAQRVTLNEEDDTTNTNQPIAADDGEGEGTQPAAQQPEDRRPLAPDAQRVALNEEDDTTGTKQPVAGDDGAQPQDTGTTAQQTQQQTQEEQEQTERQQRDAVSFAKQYGYKTASDTGTGVVIRSWNSGRQMSEAQLAEIDTTNQLAKYLNVRAEYHDTIGTPGGQGANGYYWEKDPNGTRVIHIAQDAEHPFLTVMGHELTHMIETNNQAGFQRLWNFLEGLAQRTGLDLDQLQEDVIRRYQLKDGTNLLGKTLEEIKRRAQGEVLANAAFDIIGDRYTVSLMAAQDRNLLQRIGDWVSKIRQQIRNMLNQYADKTPQARMLRDTDGALAEFQRIFLEEARRQDELKPSKQAAASVGENSRATSRYQEAMRSATSRQEMNQATRELAGELLKDMKLEATKENVDRLLSAAMLKAASGQTISESLAAAGVTNVWANTPEQNRAFMALSKYIGQMMQEEDTAGYQGLFEEGEKYSLANMKAHTITDQNGTELAQVTENGTVARYSVKSWSETDKTQLRDELVEMGYDKTEVDKWIDDVDSVAQTILDNADRLDYDADDEMSFVKPNAEYVITVDASTLCAKRRLYQGIFNEIQRQLPNTALQPGDLTNLINLMNKHDKKTPCSICYVESRRKWMGRYAKRWLNQYEGEYKPSIYEVTTTDGLARLRKEHRQAYDDFINAMNRKGSANPKVVQPRTEYRGELRELTPGMIEKIIKLGGVRVQSFSDFETVHLIDMMQVIMDMSAMNLTAQAYTKVPTFALVFGGTGMKINISTIGLGKGVDENGNLLFDDKEGVPFETALELRAMYPKDVGIILVGISDEHILAAWKDPRVDQVIPFHASGWNKTDRKQNPKIAAYSDYTYCQNEYYFVKDANGNRLKSANGRYKRAGIKSGNLSPIDYWDFNKSGTENAKRYLELCAEQGRIPKFYPFLQDNGDGSFSLKKDGSTDGYWKSLTDYKMYDNDGVGAPQRIVRPVFNMKEANKALAEYEGGASVLPVDHEIVDEFVQEYKETHPRVAYSLKETTQRDAEYQQSVESGDEAKQKEMVEQAAKDAGYTIEGWHGSEAAPFTVFKPGLRGEMWFASTETTAYNRSEMYHVYLKMNNAYEETDYVGPNSKFDPTKVTEEGRSRGHDGAVVHFRLDPKYVNMNLDSISKTVPASHKIGDMFMFLPRGEDRKNLAKPGETLVDFMKRGRDEDLYRWYTVYKPEQIKSAAPVVYDNQGKVIPLSERFNEEHPDIRYSLRDDTSVLEGPKENIIRYSEKEGRTPEQARDEFDLYTSLARTDDNSWNLIRQMLDMKQRATQNADGTVSRETGHWKKGLQKYAKSVGDSIMGYAKSDGFVQRKLRELYEAMDRDTDKGTHEWLSEALQMAQATAQEIYIGDQQENPLKEELKSFFDEVGALKLGPDELSELNHHLGGAMAFRNRAAGIVKLTSFQGGAGIEMVYEDLAKRFGLSEADNAGTQIAELNDLLLKAKETQGVPITDEEFEYINKVAMDLVASYILAGQSVAMTRTTERMDTEEQRQLVIKNQQLEQQLEQQNQELGSWQDKYDEARRAADFYAERGKASFEALSELKRQGVTAETMRAAQEGLNQANEDLKAAQQRIKDTEKKLEAARAKRDEYRRQLNAAQRQQNRQNERSDQNQRAYERLQKQQQRMMDELAKQRESIRKARDQARKNEKRRKAIESIRKGNTTLRQMIAHPNKNSFVPQQHVRAVAEFVDALSRGDGRQTAKAGAALQRALKDAAASDDYNTSETFDKGLQDMLDESLRILETKTDGMEGEQRERMLRNMTDDEIELLAITVTGIVHQLRTADTLIGLAKQRQVFDAGTEWIQLLNKHQKDLSSKIGQLARKAVQEHMSPQRFMAQLAHHEQNIVQELSDELSQGQRDMNKLRMQATKLIQPLTEGENAKRFDQFTGKNAVWYDTGVRILDQKGQETDRTVRMTGAMRASLYMHWQSEENRDGMKAGVKNASKEDLYQLTMPDENLLKAGKVEDAYKRGYRAYLTAGQIQQILDEMTDYEKAWCEAWKTAEETIWRDAINRTSLTLNAFRIANTPNYFPISRDPSYIGKELDTVVMDERLTSKGFLKARVKAHNPMLLLDIADVFRRQIDGVSQYAGLAVPIRDFMRVYNVNMPGYADSVKAALNRTQGVEASKYMEKMIRDLQGGNKTQSSFLDQLRGKYAGATLGMNMSVIIKQAASYPAAASVVSYQSLARAARYFLTPKAIDANLIDTWTSAHWERRSQNLRDLEANANRNNPAKRGIHKLGNGIQAMDVLTTKVLWKAAEFEVQNTRADLAVGTDEYYEEVGKLYDRILEETQPEYSTMQRPGILRHESQLLKSVTMFKTQSIQNFGILFDSISRLNDMRENLKENPNSEEARQAYQAAKTQVARAVSSQVMSAVVLSVMTMLGRMLLHKMRDYEDDKGDLTPESVGSRLMRDSVSSVAGMVVGGSELFDLIMGVAEGKSPFDIEAAGVSTINDLYQNTYSLLSAAQVLNDADMTPQQKMEKLQPKLWKFAGSVTQMFGFPMNNVRNLIDGIAANTMDFVVGKPFSFQESGITFLGAAQGRDTSNKAVAMYIGQALMEGNEVEATRLYNEQLRQGKSADSLNSAILTWQRENIPEIREAAEAIEAGDISTYNQKLNAATQKGVSMANAVKMAESERKKLTKTEPAPAKKREYTYDEILAGLTTDSTESSYSKSVYTNGQMNSLLEDGNIDAAIQVRDAMLEGGKTQTQINSSLTSYWKERLKQAYDEGDMAEVRRISEMLQHMGMKQSTIQKWTTSGTSLFGGSGTFGSSSKKSGGFGSGTFGSSSKKTSKSTGFGSGTFGSSTKKSSKSTKKSSGFGSGGLFGS